MRMLANYMQASRLRMADIGLALLEHSSVADEHKRMIRKLMDEAYNPVFMVSVSAIMPVYTIKKIMGRANRITQPSDEVKSMYNEFCTRFVTSVAAANPVFAMIAAAEMAILTMILFPLGQLWRTQDIQFGTVQAADEALEAVGRVLHRQAT